MDGGVVSPCASGASPPVDHALPNSSVSRAYPFHGIHSIGISSGRGERADTPLAAVAELPVGHGLAAFEGAGP